MDADTFRRSSHEIKCILSADINDIGPSTVVYYDMMNGQEVNRLASAVRKKAGGTCLKLIY